MQREEWGVVVVCSWIEDEQNVHVGMTTTTTVFHEVLSDMVTIVYAVGRRLLVI
jgi:hypothetical protein